MIKYKPLLYKNQIFQHAAKAPDSIEIADEEIKNLEYDE